MYAFYFIFVGHATIGIVVLCLACFTTIRCIYLHEQRRCGQRLISF